MLYDGRLRTSDSFRRINPAASLKRRATRRDARRLRGFPPDKSGGLIEARRQSETPSCTTWKFPPDKSGGLIEARGRAGSRERGTVGQFPPDKSGGLIEAIVLLPFFQPPLPSFRRINPAASLKPGILIRMPHRSVSGFRRINPAASLKRAEPAGHVGSTGRVSAG